MKVTTWTVIIGLILVALFCWAFKADAVIFISRVAGGTQISDDFSSDTSANYTTILRGIVISAGVAQGNSESYQSASVYHETVLDSPDHYIKLKVTRGAVVNQYTAPVIRVSPGATPGTTATGYRIFFGAAYASLNKFNQAAADNISDPTWIANYAVSYASTWTGGVYHTCQLSAVGSTFTLEVDFNDDGDFNDGSENLGAIANTAYSGSYVGLFWSSRTDLPYVDNLVAD